MRKTLLMATTMLLSATLTSCGGEHFSAVSLAGGNSSVRELTQEVHTLRMEVDALNEELRMLYSRGEVQEDLISSLRQDLASQDSPKASKGVENRLTKLEKNQRTLTSDLANLKKHADQANSTLTFQKKKLSDVETNLDQLLAAMQQLAGATTTKKANYVVKSGDTLEKIAKRNNTSIAQLKKINGLSNDRIYAGQSLKVR